MAKQIFFDDFTGGSLDTSKWSPVWGKFDPEKGTQMRFSDKNISASGGYLYLNGTVATGTDAEKAPFLSGMVSTRKPDKGEILFQAKGQFIVSVQAKLPSAPSSWPGIWMTGTKGDWPACGEIDILEAKGWQPKDYQVNTHTPRAGAPTKSQQNQKTYVESIKNTNFAANVYNGQTDFNIYSVVKLNDRVDFYWEDQLIHTVKYSEMDDPTPFTDPENGWIIRLSHIIGGSFLEYEGNREYVDATKHKDKYPSRMIVGGVVVISLDEQGELGNIYSSTRGILAEYTKPQPQPQPVVPDPEPPVEVPPTPSPQPPTPEPPVVVPPTPAPEPAPTPAPKPRGKNNWVREEEALVFIML
jgi:hypothetical protein|nr:MAG TPA: hypothetical protein [Bacteriophage sp.]